MRFWFFNYYPRESADYISPLERVIIKEKLGDRHLVGTSMGWGKSDFDDVHPIFWHINSPPFIVKELLIKRHL